MSSATKGDAFSPPICLVALLVAKKTTAPSGVQTYVPSKLKRTILSTILSRHAVTVDFDHDTTHARHGETDKF
jgi:hypothetical protein